MAAATSTAPTPAPRESLALEIFEESKLPAIFTTKQQIVNFVDKLLEEFLKQNPRLSVIFVTDSTIKCVILKSDGSKSVPLANISITNMYFTDSTKNTIIFQIYFLDFWTFKDFPKEIVDGCEFINFKKADEIGLKIKKAPPSFRQNLSESATITHFTEKDKERFEKMFPTAQTIIEEAYM
jgi:hypothetical protein